MQEKGYFKNVLKQFPFVALVKVRSQKLYYGSKLHTFFTPMALTVVKYVVLMCGNKLFRKIFEKKIYKWRLKYQKVGLA